MEFPIRVELKEPLQIETRHFKTVAKEYLIFDTEYEYFIQKWDYDKVEYKKTITKEEYENCEYPEIDLMANNDEFSKDVVQYTVIKSKDFTIKIKLYRFNDAESLAEEMAKDIANIPSLPADELPYVVEISSYLDSTRNEDIIVID